MAMAASRGGHIAVLTFPFGSHAFPLLALIKRLANAAPNLTFSFFNTTKSNQTLFSKETLHDYTNIKPYNVEDGLPADYVFSGNPMEPIERFISATPDSFRVRMAEVEEETGLRFTCLLTDAFLWCSVNIAEEKGIPWVAFWTAGPTSLSVHMNTDVIRSVLGLTGFSSASIYNFAAKLLGKEPHMEKTLDFLPGLSAIKASDLPDEVLYLNRPFSQLLYKMGFVLPRASAVLLNSFDGIDPEVTHQLKSSLQKLLNIGPFTLTSPPTTCSDENDCLSWLDKNPPGSVVYISFGTVLTPPSHELIALAEALEAKKTPYLWSFRDQGKGNLLNEFVERTNGLGKIAAWAPQLQVLAHSSVAVFVTHCGWNSVMEGVTAGVPMICRPFFGDQRMNGRLIEDVWKIGVGMNGLVFTKQGLMDALDFVLSKENRERIRQNISVLKDSAMKAAAASGSSAENFNILVETIVNTETTS